jgi:hypothetical protein
MALEHGRKPPRCRQARAASGDAGQARSPAGSNQQ